MARGFIFFDIDGTLTRGTTSAAFVAKRLHSEATLSAAEAAYKRGEIDNDEVCRIDAAAWKGFRPRDVEKWLADLPLIRGIEKTVETCRRRDLEPYLASLTWNFIGNHLADRFGFAGCCGPELEVRNDIFSGRVAATFDEYDKRLYAQSLCERLDVDIADCAAVGDSRSDVPLFGAVGFSVAFNASLEAQKAASCSVTGDSLTAVLPAIDRWLRDNGR